MSKAHKQLQGIAANYLNWRPLLVIVSILGTAGFFAPAVSPAANWYVSAGGDASDANPGTAPQPVRSVGKAVSLAKAGDVIVNNTVAFNQCDQVVRVENRPPQNEYRNGWFRNHIFWQNTGPVAVAPGLDPKEFDL